jgi:uncharacterized protein
VDRERQIKRDRVALENPYTSFEAQEPEHLRHSSLYEGLGQLPSLVRACCHNAWVSSPDVQVLTAVGVAALLASFLGAVARFGGAVVLLPVLVLAFGVRDAVPILTVVQVVAMGPECCSTVANWCSRWLAGLHSARYRWRCVADCSSLPHRLHSSRACAAPFCCSQSCIDGLGRAGHKDRAAWVRWARDRRRLQLSLMGTVGPVVAALLLSNGLLGAAYIGTDAVTALTMLAVKLVVYGGATVLTVVAIGEGLTIGLIMIAGTYLGKHVLD